MQVCASPAPWCGGPPYRRRRPRRFVPGLTRLECRFRLGRTQLSGSIRTHLPLTFHHAEQAGSLPNAPPGSLRPVSDRPGRRARPRHQGRPHSALRCAHDGGVGRAGRRHVSMPHVPACRLPADRPPSLGLLRHTRDQSPGQTSSRAFLTRSSVPGSNPSLSFSNCVYVSGRSGLIFTGIPVSGWIMNILASYRRCISALRAMPLSGISLPFLVEGMICAASNAAFVVSPVITHCLSKAMI